MSIIPSDAATAVVDVTTSGDHIIVAGSGSTQIQVINMLVIAADTVTVQWFSDSSSGTELSGPMSLVTAQGWASALGEYLVTDAGEDLVLNLDSAVQVGGTIAYRLL